MVITTLIFINRLFDRSAVDSRNVLATTRVLSFREATMFRSVVVLLAVIAVNAACSSDPVTPAPTPPATPAVTGVAISGFDAIRTGFFSNYTATATLSNGTTQDVTATATWTSSNLNVGSVAAGRLDGNAHGSVVITASYQSISTTKTVSVVQNFGGQWSGTYVLNVCDNSGSAAQAGWCQGRGVGSLYPFTLILTQGGNSQTEMSGTFGLGSLSGNVSGNVTGDGRLVIGGSYGVNVLATTARVEIGGFEARATSGDSLTGGWAMNLTIIGFAGNAYEQHLIRNANHLSAQALPRPVTATYTFRTFGELFEHLAR